VRDGVIKCEGGFHVKKQAWKYSDVKDGFQELVCYGVGFAVALHSALLTQRPTRAAC
jgi:hypothetical protein